MTEQEKREKVIRGLECCDGYCDEDTGCPYFDSEEGFECEERLKKDAIELLKAQEPVKPVFERQFMTSIEIYDCGKCGTSLGAKGIAKYCMDCGQAVKWD